MWSCDIIVDWADPQEEPDEDTMARVKVLYCRNLTATVTEESLRETFERWDLVVFMFLWSVQKGDLKDTALFTGSEKWKESRKLRTTLLSTSRSETKLLKVGWKS